MMCLTQNPRLEKNEVHAITSSIAQKNNVQNQDPESSSGRP